MLKLYYVRRNVLTHKLYHFTCRSFIMIMITITIAGVRIAKDLLVFMLFPFAMIFLNIAVSVLNNQSLAHYFHTNTHGTPKVSSSSLHLWMKVGSGYP